MAENALMWCPPHSLYTTMLPAHADKMIRAEHEIIPFVEGEKLRLAFLLHQFRLSPSTIPHLYAMIGILELQFSCKVIDQCTHLVEPCRFVLWLFLFLRLILCLRLGWIIRAHRHRVAL